MTKSLSPQVDPTFPILTVETKKNGGSRTITVAGAGWGGQAVSRLGSRQVALPTHRKTGPRFLPPASCCTLSDRGCFPGVNRGPPWDLATPVPHGPAPGTSGGKRAAQQQVFSGQKGGYRGSSLIRNRLLTWDCHRSLGMVLLWGPTGWCFLISEVHL